MGSLDGFYSTWSNAQAVFGQGTPEQGDQLDGSTQLRQVQSTVEAAAPGTRWTGNAADAYASANADHASRFGRMAELDQRLASEVDRSAAVVTAGRQNLDAIKQWVRDAAASLPAGVNREELEAQIARRGIDEVADVVRRSNNELNSIGGRIHALGQEYATLGGNKGTDESQLDRKPGKPGDESEPKIQTLMGDEGWQYPWDPPPPPDSAPGGGRWQLDPTPHPSGPGGGPPMGPFAQPQPWHRDIKPPVEGGPTGYQDVVGSPPNGWGVDPSWRMQENYKFRLTGETFNGKPDHIRWVQRDGNWYQAKWIDYNYEAEHMRRGVSGTGFFTPNFGMNEWHPIDIKDIYQAQAHNLRLTMYLPTPDGGQFVLDPKRPMATAP